MCCVSRRDRVSKTLSEAEACVSAEAETGSGEHGVRDHVFAFRSLRMALKALFIGSSSSL